MFTLVTTTRSIACILVLTISLAGSCFGEEPSRCEGNPGLVGGCFKIHGRLTTKNGGPALPLWIIGTHRALGVFCPRGTESDCPVLPSNVAFVEGTPPSEILLFADFLVCPFTRSRPGWMQFVCIERAHRLVVERWDDASHSYRYVSGPTR